MNSAESLYERLGGHDGIWKLLKSFYEVCGSTKFLGRFFMPTSQTGRPICSKSRSFGQCKRGASRYRGGFGVAHVPLRLQPEHFRLWLGLWEFNKQRNLPPLEAAEMTAIAQQLAHRLFALTQRRSADFIDIFSGRNEV